MGDISLSKFPAEGTRQPAGEDVQRTNHVNLSDRSTGLNGARFGEISSAGGIHVIQFTADCGGEGHKGEPA
jgi:hypothetical protein